VTANQEILLECIAEAKKRIEYYEMLHCGLWQVIFQPDATDEIEKEKKYIEELEQMLHELRLSE